MLREIKFRVWNSEDEVMFYSDPDDFTLVRADRPEKRFGIIMQGRLGNLLGYPIMQFTGLHDVNGKEIYEGDILQTTHKIRFGTSVSGRGRNWYTFAKDKEVTEGGVVEYRYGQWLVVFQSFHDYDSYFLCTQKSDKPKHLHEQVIEELHNDPRKHEVIGNIHENPELIEAEDA